MVEVIDDVPAGTPRCVADAIVDLAVRRNPAAV
jgi:hypothetical protein